MEDLRYILDEPISIPNMPIGLAHPIKLKDYIYKSDLFDVLQIQMLMYLQTIPVEDVKTRNFILTNVKNWDVVCMDSSNIVRLINLIKFIFKLDEEIKIETNWNEVVFQLIKSGSIKIEANNYKKEIKGFDESKSIVELGKKVYLSVNNFKINRDNYEILRESLIKMNRLRFSKIAGDKESQKWFDKARNAKKSGKDPTMTDIITTIVALTGFSFKELKEMTMYQIDNLSCRVSKIKEIDMNVQYLCAGAKDIELESYMVHIDNSLEEKLTTSVEEFQNSMGGL